MKTALHVLGFAVAALAVVAAGLGIAIGSELRFLVFSEPLWFAGLFLPVLAVVLRQVWMPRPATMKFSRARSLGRLRGGVMARLAHLPDGLRLAAALLVVVCLTRPQSTRGSDRIKHKGIDVVLVLDLSESMETPDIPPSRLTAAKAVVDDFIARRPRDRISLVAFGSAVSTLAPLTMDHGVLRQLVSRLRIGMIDGQHTAIGDGLGVALNRLAESEADSQVVVLLTDGLNNWGENDPDTVASEAAERKVKVYTVLMGRDLQGRDGNVDAGQLERIASVTGGFAYTAVDQEQLRGSFQDVLDKLDRSEIEGNVIRPERFEWFLWPAFLLLLLDVGLRTTRLRRFP